MTLKRAAGRALTRSTACAAVLMAVGCSLTAGSDSAGATTGWSYTMPADAVQAHSDISSSLPVDGRVWWLRAAGPRWTLESRALAGGVVHRVVLRADGLLPPEPAPGSSVRFSVREVEDLRVGGGRLYVTGSWKSVPSGAADGSGQDTSSETLSAVFDVSSGALLRQARPLRTPQGLAPSGLVRGTPAVVAALTPALSFYSGALSDPWSQVPYGTSASVVSGRFALQRVPDGRPGPRDPSPTSWSGKRGLLRVVDLAGDRSRYQLGASSVRRAADAPSVVVGADAASPLMSDGSLKIIARRTRGTGMRAVGVDRRGVVRRLSGALRNVSLTDTVVGFRRAFVYVGGSRGRPGRSRECGGLWITDVSGRRGRRLDLGSFARTTDGAAGAPVWWDGRHAVWVGYTRRLRVVVHVEDLRGARLRRADVPSCR